MIDLVFRKLSSADTENIFLACKGNVANYFYKFETLKQTEDWVNDAIVIQNQGEKLEYVVYEKDNFVGMISPRYLGATTVDIGMWVAPNFQGKGYGKSILETLLSILRREGIREVIYETEKNNMASAALAESSGFKLFSTGDTLVYKLLLD